MYRLLALLSLALPLVPLTGGPSPAADRQREQELPRFTEEREAAALFFVKKHVPEVLPLLERLKKSNNAQYQLEIREVFRVTEMLADLQDDPRRYDLELRIWKAESKALALVARLSTPAEEERRKAEVALLDLARELVDLDVQVLELRAEQLDKELGEIKDELARARDGTDKQVRARYEALLDQAKRKKK
jgi:hypothetical protein